MKKIAVMTTGGTIFGISNNRMDLSDYKSGINTNNQIFNELPEIKNFAEIEIESINNFSSCEMTPSHWNELKVKALTYLNEQDFDGVVITHGTNTIEETAYFLHLTCNTDKPIVLVGSQRPPTSLSSDAHLNLYNAIRLAASEIAKEKGVLVMLNDQINSAREVTKTNTYRVETFKSGELGILGYVDVDGEVCFYRYPTKRHTSNSRFNTIDTNMLPTVDIVYSYAGADGRLIYSLIESDCKGIVIAGTGAGKFSKKEEIALGEAKKKGVQVVRSNRVGNGRVIPLKQYEEYGFIAADNLLPQKARILLMLAMKVTNDTNEIQELYRQY